MESTLIRLQNWYKLNCNGDWEHKYRMIITNLDNPGWDIKIETIDTALENIELKLEFNNPNNEFDWYIIKSTNGMINISCGIDNFEKTLNIFFDEIIPKHSDPKFLYEIFLPLSGHKFDIYTPAKGKLINEKTIKLVEILPIEYRNIKLKELDLNEFNPSDLDKLKLHNKIGDEVTIELIRVFDGLILTELKK